MRATYALILLHDRRACSASSMHIHSRVAAQRQAAGFYYFATSHPLPLPRPAVHPEEGQVEAPCPGLPALQVHHRGGWVLNTFLGQERTCQQVPAPSTGAQGECHVPYHLYAPTPSCQTLHECLHLQFQPSWPLSSMSYGLAPYGQHGRRCARKCPPASHPRALNFEPHPLPTAAQSARGPPQAREDPHCWAAQGEDREGAQEALCLWWAGSLALSKTLDACGLAWSSLACPSQLFWDQGAELRRLWLLPRLSLVGLACSAHPCFWAASTLYSTVLILIASCTPLPSKPL